MLAKSTTSVSITSKHPVHRYKGKTFQEVFGSNPQVKYLLLMTPIQHTIRQSIVHAKSKRGIQIVLSYV